MSKKLIAVAAAAALALTGLVAVPAQAATITTDINNVNAADNYATAATAFVITHAMESGTLDYVGETTGTVARFEVTTGAATTLAISTTGGVKLTDTLEDSNEDALKIGAGSATLTKATKTGDLTYTFYAYTNSTTAGSVVVDSGSQKKTYFIKATAGSPQNLVDVKFPASVLSNDVDTNASTNLITYQVTDAFGNKLTSGATVALTATGATVTAGANGTYNNATAKKRWENWVTGTTQASVSMQLSLTATDLTGAGFPKANKVAFSTTSAGSLADQVKTLTAQVTDLTGKVAALTTQLEASRPVATSVTKKKYNTLARKWNAANPSNKVALKK